MKTGKTFDEELSEFGLPQFRKWYRYGLRSPVILLQRLRSKYAPVFRLRMAWQRAARGYGDNDLWNLNYAVATLIAAGCHEMRVSGHGYPTEFSEVEFGGDGGGWEKWEDILRRIEEGFQAWIDEDGWFRDHPEQEAKFKEGMDLFSHWFSALWD